MPLLLGQGLSLHQADFALWRLSGCWCNWGTPPCSLQTQEKYEKVLDELNKCTPQYMESMEQVFEQCQQFEEKRLNFLKEVLLDIKRHLNLAESSR